MASAVDVLMCMAYWHWKKEERDTLPLGALPQVRLERWLVCPTWVLSAIPNSPESDPKQGSACFCACPLEIYPKYLNIPHRPFLLLPFVRSLIPFTCFRPLRSLQGMTLDHQGLNLGLVSTGCSGNKPLWEQGLGEDQKGVCLCALESPLPPRLGE